MPIYSKDVDPWVPLHSSIGSGPRGNGLYVSSIIYTTTNTDVYHVGIDSLHGPDVDDVHDGDLVAFKSKFGDMTFYHIGVVTSRSNTVLTVRSVIRSDEWSVDQAQMKRDWDSLKTLVDTAIENAESATDDMNDLIDEIRETLANDGFKGDKGDKGDAFVFEDFTDAQLLDLRQDVSSIYYRRVSNVYITDENDKIGTPAIPLDANVFDSSTMLFVFVNGLLCGTNEYTVLADGTVVRFNHAFSVSGTRIEFIGVKAIAITAEDYDALKGDPAPASEVSAAVVAYLQSHPELVFVGATSSADGRDGLVPGPTTWARNAALFGDGSWSRIDITNDPTVTTGYSISLDKESESDTETLGSLVIPVATSSAIGMMSAEDKAKLDGIGTGANQTNLQLVFQDGITWAEITKVFPNNTQFSLPFANLDNSHHVRTENLPEIPEEKIADNAITSAKLASSSVTNEKLASNSVTTAKIADGSVTTLKLADVSVTTEKLANSSVTAFKIRDGVITDEKLVQSGGVLSRVSTLEDKTRLVTQATNGLMSAVDKTKLDNMGDGTIPAGSITTSKIADSAVVTQKIADGAVTTDKLADDVIDSIEADIQPFIQAAESATEAATDAAALATRAAAATWNAGNVLKGTLAEGTVLTADDAWAAPPESVDVFGVSTQVTTTGKNLLNPANVIRGYFYVPDTVIRGEGTSIYAPVVGGTTYTMSGGNGNRRILAFTTELPAVGVAIFGDVTAGGTSTPYTFTAPDNAQYVVAYVDSSSTLTPSGYQIEQGSTATSYEPYTGGKPAPSPDYPQPINSVDDLTLWLCGKNLYSSSTAYIGGYFSNGAIVGGTANDRRIVYLPCVGGQTFTVSRKAVTTNERFQVAYTTEAPASGTPIYGIIAAPDAETVGNSMALTITTGNDARYLVIWAFWGGYTDALDTLQIELGTTATAYAPYVGQSVEIPLSNNALRSLPDGTRDTVTLSYIGPSTREGWGVFGMTFRQVADTLDLGTLTWSKLGEKTVYHAYIANAVGVVEPGKVANIMCTDYIVTNYSTAVNNDGYIALAETTHRTYIYDSNYTDAASFKQAVSGAILQFQLATPITHDLGTVELPVNPAPDLTAWADGGSAQPTLALTYEQDINIVIARLKDAIADMATS